MIQVTYLSWADAPKMMNSTAQMRKGERMLLIDVAIGWILYTLSAPLWVWVIFIFGAVLED